MVCQRVNKIYISKRKTNNPNTLLQNKFILNKVKALVNM